jgi:hypothetical protein
MFSGCSLESGPGQTTTKTLAVPVTNYESVGCILAAVVILAIVIFVARFVH